LRSDTGSRLLFQGGDLTIALKKLDALAGCAALMFAHNLIALNLPHLKAANFDLRLFGCVTVCFAGSPTSARSDSLIL